jgi:regulator of sigma E protease
MGRSLARGLKEKLGAVSMALLLLLAVYVTMNDIGRLGG